MVHKYNESKNETENASKSRCIGVDDLKDAIICHECNVSSANLTCVQCKVKYCHPCFAMVHSAKVLKSHWFRTLKTDKKVFTVTTQKCNKHKILCDKFCVNCKLCICKFCENEKHIEHKTVSLLTENANHQHEVDNCLESTRTRSQICRQSLQVSFFLYLFSVFL